MALYAITLSTGSIMPIFGLGTWKSKPGEVKASVLHALKCGYKLFDCAAVYGNEAEIGEAFSEAKFKREEIFVTSKLWNTFHRPQYVRTAFLKTLSDLKLTYLDLYLIHWPHSFVYSGPELFPKNEDGSMKYDDADYLETWKELEKLYDEGLVKNIGLSNFNSLQIQRILDNCRIKPTSLQIENHPYAPQEKLVRFLHNKGISVMAYSPLGSPDRPWAQGEDPSLFDDPVVKRIAEKHKKTPAQILIRFPIDRGITVIPKSVTPARIEENLQVLSFSLDPTDVKDLLALDRNFRFCPLSRDKNAPNYPFVSTVEF